MGEFMSDEKFEGINYLDMNDFLDVIHEHSDKAEGCKQIAMKIKRKELDPGKVIDVNSVLLVNGEKPKIGEVVVCGSCGKEIDLMTVKTFMECVAITVVRAEEEILKGQGDGDPV